MQKGYIAFTSLLIIAAAVLAISVSIVLLAVTENQTSLSYKKGQEALAAAQGCAEEALLRLRDDATYTGGTPTIGNTSCGITITGTTPNFTIDVIATLAGATDYVQALKLTVRRAGNHINVLTWRQVP